MRVLLLPSGATGGLLPMRTSNTNPRLRRAERAYIIALFLPKSLHALSLAERWLSGRKHRIANAAYGQNLYLGFESRPLRQFFCSRLT